MSNKVKRIKTAVALLLLAAMFLSGGCWSQRELKDLHITIGVGIDKDPNGTGEVMLTAQIVNPQKMKAGGSGDSSGGGGGGQKAYINHTSTGSNTFDAIREFTHEISERLYQAHTQVIVIGRDVAEEGIEKYLDFFIRAVETRPTTKIVIAQGTALETLCVEPEKESLPAMQINKLVESQELNSQSKPATIQEYISAMVSKTFSFTAPILRIETVEDKSKHIISGMAVFKQDRMVGELSEDESRGLLWVEGKIKSGIIDVSVDEGEAAIEIKSAGSKVKTNIYEGSPSVDINIDVQGAMGTQTCQRNLATMEGIAELEGLAEQAIIGEISSAFDKARSLDADVFGFGEEFHKYHNSEWKQMEDSWGEIFPGMTVNLKVTVKIVSTGIITKPARPEKGQQ